MPRAAPAAPQQRPRAGCVPVSTLTSARAGSDRVCPATRNWGRSGHAARYERPTQQRGQEAPSRWGHFELTRPVSVVEVRRLDPSDRAAAQQMFKLLTTVFDEPAEPLHDDYVEQLPRGFRPVFHPRP